MKEGLLSRNWLNPNPNPEAPTPNPKPSLRYIPVQQRPQQLAFIQTEESAIKEIAKLYGSDVTIRIVQPGSETAAAAGGSSMSKVGCSTLPRCSSIPNGGSSALKNDSGDVPVSLMGPSVDPAVAGKRGTCAAKGSSRTLKGGCSDVSFSLEGPSAEPAVAGKSTPMQGSRALKGGSSAMSRGL